MIKLRNIAEFLLVVAVIAIMGRLAAGAVVYCLDDETDQVRDGIKDPRTVTLPVIPIR